MAFTHLKIVRIVSRRYFNTACSKILVYILILHNRDFTAGQRQFQHLSNQFLISVILRVYRNCSIAQHRLRTCGCNFYKPVLLPDNRIIDMPKKSVLLLMLYFGIGDGSLADWTPVDNSGAFVNISFFIELCKYFQHGIGASLIHGKTLSVPVCRGT